MVILLVNLKQWYSISGSKRKKQGGSKMNATEIWMLRQMFSDAGQKIMSAISPVLGIRREGGIVIK